ncbi:hypothetical protein JXM83_05165 [Candidatus Woesearchaeota archaeon]|nr:hypothetical protein [Candidatus Woesearchaeota archaeon]
MTNNTAALHHLHVTKRIIHAREKYPHPNKFKSMLDKIIYFIGLTGPLMTIPQILKIWSEKSAAGVSMISWMTYLITAFFWLAYGITHKEKPIVITYIFWILTEGFVVAGIFIYG